MLIEARRKYQSGNASLEIASQDLDSLAKKPNRFLREGWWTDTMRESVRSHLRIVALSFLAGPGKPIDLNNINFDLSNLNRDLYRPFLAGLYKTALSRRRGHPGQSSGRPTDAQEPDHDAAGCLGSNSPETSST